jgi:protein ImuB
MRRGRKPIPILLAGELARQEIVVRCCVSARAAGVYPGMTVAEARALCPHGVILPFDAARSCRALEALAVWMNRYTPVASVDPTAPADVPLPTPDGLLLDVTGVAHLFGGEQLLLADVALRLDRAGFASRAAIAPTIGAAWALARYGAAPLATVDDEQLAHALDPLPTAALRIDDTVQTQLAQVGVQRAGELLKLRREALLTRFGEAVLRRIDQAFGRVSESIDPLRPSDPLAIRQQFEGPSTQLEAVQLAAQRLIEEVCEALAVRESGTRGLRVECERGELPPVSREVMLGRASRDPAHLWKLLRPKVETLHLGHGVEAVTVTATWTETIGHEQAGMWEKDVQADRRVEELLDTLVNRWGAARVLQAEPVPSHVPERFYHFAPTSEGEQKKGRAGLEACTTMDRPSRLLERPESAQAMALLPDHPPAWLRWRGRDYNVLAGLGPERIVVTGKFGAGRPAAVGGPPRTRDYYKIQLEGGQWVWAFRLQESGEWFVHGVWA